MYLQIIILLMLAISGCASVTRELKQRVLISTPGAPNTKCSLTSKSLGRLIFTTPEAFEIPRSSETVEIRCHKTCFHDMTKSFTPSINDEDLASNAFFGGVAPLGIDLATKKYYNYSYDLIIQMSPDNRCGLSRKNFLDGDSKDFNNQISDFSFSDSGAIP